MVQQDNEVLFNRLVELAWGMIDGRECAVSGEEIQWGLKESWLFLSRGSAGYAST